MDIFLTVVEYIGVISFALSGSAIAVSKKTDAVGALVFALLTCFGGGFIRDITLGVTPRILTVPSYRWLALTCVVVALLCFIMAFIPKTANFLTKHQHNFVVDFTDAVGLSVFCIFGVNVAIEVCGGDNSLLLIFCGCITGVGGGMLRDVFSAEIPFILRKHIYLIPTIVGTVFYTFTYDKIPYIASMLISVGIIITLRVLAIVFKWNLPVPHGAGDGIKEKTN